MIYLRAHCGIFVGIWIMPEAKEKKIIIANGYAS